VKAPGSQIILAAIAFAFLVGCSRNSPIPTQIVASPSPSQEQAGFTREKATAQFKIALLRFQNNGSIDQARGGFMDALKIDPAYPEPHYNLGILAAREEKWDEAVAWLTEYRNLDQTSDLSVKAQLLIDKYAALAKEDSAPGGKIKRKYNEALQSIGAALKANDLKKAIAFADAAIAIDGTRWEAFALKSTVLAQTGDLQNASDSIDQALHRAPANQQTTLLAEQKEITNRIGLNKLLADGSNALASKDFAGACDDFNKAWQLSPNNEQIGIRVASAAMLAKDFDLARSSLERLKSSASKVVQDKVSRLSEDLTKVQEADSKLAASKRSLAASPAAKRYADMHNWLAFKCAAKKDYQQALQEYTKAIAAEPDDPGLYANRGHAYNKNGAYNEAIADFSEAIRLNMKNADIYFNRGLAYEKRGKWNDALADFKEASALNPKDADAFNAIAWVLAASPEASIRSGTEAVEAGKKACTLSKWKVSYHIDTLAVAFAEAGDFPQAIKYAQQAMQTKGLSDEDQKALQERLALYRQGQPYHESLSHL